MHKGRMTMLYLATSIALMTACGGSEQQVEATSIPAPAIAPISQNPVVNEYQYLCASIAQQQSPACAAKQPQSIAPVILQSLVSQQSYDLSRRSSANLATTLISLSPHVCQLEQERLITLHEGICILNFSQAGNAVYQPAASLEVRIPVYQPQNLPIANLAQCQRGHLAQAYKDSALQTLNDIRALHGLNPVIYDAQYDDEMMHTALLNLANDRLTHYPNANMACYSDVAAKGAGSSNLELNYYRDMSKIDARDPIINALTERYSQNLGHRRWLLSPFLTRISFGAIMNNSINSQQNYATAYATKVVFPEDLFKPTQTNLGLIAYPYQNYPARYFQKGVPLSLSILVDQSASWKNEIVDFSKAELIVTERGSNVEQQIRDLQFDRAGQGLPNHLQFYFDDLQYHRFYDVSLKNVLVSGTAQNYQYWFRVLD